MKKSLLEIVFKQASKFAIFSSQKPHSIPHFFFTFGFADYKKAIMILMAK